MYKFWTVRCLQFTAIFFIFGVTISSLFYPGGNIHNPEQIGYSITHNFLSDLGGYKSHSGEVNFISSFFFNLSMFFFLIVGIAFVFVPNLFKEDLINYVLAIFGSFFFLFGTIFFAAVGLTPHDLYRELHIFFAINAFRFLIPGSFFYLIVLFRSPVQNKYSYFTIFFLISVISYVVYQMSGNNPMDNQEGMIEQASIQKLIALASVVNIFSLSFAFSSQLKNTKFY